MVPQSKTPAKAASGAQIFGGFTAALSNRVPECLFALRLTGMRRLFEDVEFLCIYKYIGYYECRLNAEWIAEHVEDICSG